MALSIGNLIHRTIVFSCMGFGIYGTVVIGQNMMVKKAAIKAEIEEQQRAAQLAAGFTPEQPKTE